MNTIENMTYDEERSLYNLKDTKVIKCLFSGPKDGESVLQEARNIEVVDSVFALRYPMWHVEKFILKDSSMNELSRAPIWYSHEGVIDSVKINSVKTLRECSNIVVKKSIIDSIEFGWKCNNIAIEDSKINSEYILFDSKNISINNLEFTGKYSFQYIENLVITNSNLNTKDAFWHSKNVVVKNTVLKGEYLGWFSENLTLENCKIIGTQPLCYCKNLKLVNCEMIDTDLAFEYSEVDAIIKGEILSVKNPKSGRIEADSIKEIVRENSIMNDTCQIILKNK